MVLVCTGHHAKPNLPTFPGQDKFKGRIIHSHSYKDHIGYEDKNVIVVGIGNSGVDLACELSRIAKSVYISTRRGGRL
jgi:dimethylaniline monooxygenase (N-oxide forming)